MNARNGDALENLRYIEWRIFKSEYFIERLSVCTRDTMIMKLARSNLVRRQRCEPYANELHGNIFASLILDFDWMQIPTLKSTARVDEFGQPSDFMISFIQRCNSLYIIYQQDKRSGSALFPRHRYAVTKRAVHDLVIFLDNHIEIESNWYKTNTTFAAFKTLRPAPLLSTFAQAAGSLMTAAGVSLCGRLSMRDVNPHHDMAYLVTSDTMRAFIVLFPLVKLLSEIDYTQRAQCMMAIWAIMRMLCRVQAVRSGYDERTHNMARSVNAYRRAFNSTVHENNDVDIGVCFDGKCYEDTVYETVRPHARPSNNMLNHMYELGIDIFMLQQWIWDVLWAICYGMVWGYKLSPIDVLYILPAFQNKHSVLFGPMGIPDAVLKGFAHAFAKVDFYHTTESEMLVLTRGLAQVVMMTILSSAMFYCNMINNFLNAPASPQRLGESSFWLDAIDAHRMRAQGASVTHALQYIGGVIRNFLMPNQLPAAVAQLARSILMNRAFLDAVAPGFSNAWDVHPGGWAMYSRLVANMGLSMQAFVHFISDPTRSPDDVVRARIGVTNSAELDTLKRFDVELTALLRSTLWANDTHSEDMHSEAYHLY